MRLKPSPWRPPPPKDPRVKRPWSRREWIVVWMAAYALWMVTPPFLQGLVGRWEDGGWAQFSMFYLTLFPGLGLGALALCWPRIWVWIPLGIASAVHVAFSLGFHPH